MKKKILSCVLAVCFIVPCLLMLSACNSGSEKTMEVSINPDVSFVLDGKNNIVSVSYDNEDAGRLYANVNFVGKDVESALQILIEQCAISGHLELDGETVELQVNGSVDADIKELENKAKEKIKNVFDDLGVTVTVEVEELSEAARKNALVATASALAPEKSLKELQEMDNAELVSLIKNKQKEFEGLVYEQVETIKDQFGSIENAILNAIQTLRDSLETLEESYEGFAAEIESLGNLVPETLRNQFNEVKAQINSKKAEIEQKINEFLEDKREEIQAAKAEYQAKKDALVSEFKTEVENHKNSFVAHLDAAKTSGEITEEQYNYWKNLVENQAA